MIGQTISHYRIVEKLGEGGMGVVYVAEDTLLGRRVAIKTLHAGRSAQDAHFRSRFLREARAVSALSHPHIATIHDYGETENGQPYLVMELVKGETLGDLMLTERLTIPRAIEIIEQVAEALAEAHRQGIVHRDIKPTNVAIDQRGEVKVLDFGLAKQINPDPANVTDPERQTLLNTQTQEGVVVGTPMYLSPEQALGVEVDARSDLFSLGALLYECIAGKPPFDGGSKIEICAKVIRDDPAPPSTFNPDVNSRLDGITLKALAKKPEARYQSADEFFAELQSVRADLQSSALDRTVTRLIPQASGTRPTGTLATLSDIFKRPRLSVGYVSVGLLVIAALGFGWWALSRPRPHQPAPEAQRMYDRAVDAMREGAFFRASKTLQQAVQDDDYFALAHARLAEAWTELDFSDKAKDELIRANDLVPDRSALPQLDGLRMQAVTDTVKRDFGKAVADYRALVSSVPAAEKAYALVDLGRAYEKNEQPDKATETYQEATKLDPHYGAAFLRLGVVLGRRQQFNDAYAAFDQAHKLFDISADIEGLTEVLVQRGVLLSQQGKVDAAREQLLRALDKSTALENKDKRIKVLLSLSNTEINAGDVTKAREYSTQAIDLARANGMENLTMQGLIDIGNIYLARGDFPEAEKNFNEALRLAQLYKGRRSEARAQLSLSSLRSQQGDVDAARELFQRAMPFYDQGGYRKEVSQAYAILGRAQDGVGDYGSAQQTFEQQLKLALQVGDPQSIALAHEGLGTVFLHTQRLPDALTHFEEDYRIEQSRNAKLNVGYAADGRASALWQLGRPQEARVALAEALAIAENAGHEPYQELLAQAHSTKAAVALSERKFPEAITESQKALDLAGSEYKAIAVRAGYTLGVAQSLSGRADARKRCEDAVNLARSIRDPLPLSEALLALAEVAMAEGDARASLASAAEAQQRFASAKQHESEWRALAIEALASEKAGDKTRAREFASQAAAALATIEQQWGNGAYTTYLTRPDVQELRKQLSVIAT